MTDKPLWTAIAADASVEPIRIVDLDVSKTTWSRVHESMRVVHLRLNRQPDLPWIRFFHEERESRINARRAGLWIEDGYIAFDCLLGDVETRHLPDIRRSLDFANQRALVLSAARQRERGAQGEAERSERLELEALRQRVREVIDPRPDASKKSKTPAPGPRAPASPAVAPPPSSSPKAAATLTGAETVHASARERAPNESEQSERERRSLEASLEHFRGTLREARKRSTDRASGNPKKSR